MIDSVINLGIKGSELVESQLNNLQKKKENLSKKSDIRIGSKISDMPRPKNFGVMANRPQPAPGGGERYVAKKEPEKVLTVDKIVAARIEIGESLGGTSGKSAKAETEGKEKKPEESEYKKNLKTELAGARSQAASSIQNFNGTGLAQAGIMGVSALGGPIGSMVGQAFNYVIDAVVAFKDKMKQQAAIVADTGAKNNTIKNSLRGKDFSNFVGYDVKDSAGNVSRKGRSDINKGEQAGITQSITSSMGKMSEEFQKEAGKLFVSKDGTKSYDVTQATSLAQGNFSALGTDKGFFMQQISSGFQGLPPSMKQKLTSQMFGMIDEDERDIQRDEGIRSVQTSFDKLDRDQAEAYVGAGDPSNHNLQLALKIQDSMYNLDIKIASGISDMVHKLDRIASAPDVSAQMMAEFRSAIADLGNSIRSLNPFR